MRKFILFVALFAAVPAANAGILKTTFKGTKAVVKTAVKGLEKVSKTIFKVAY